MNETAWRDGTVIKYKESQKKKKKKGGKPTGEKE